MVPIDPEPNRARIRGDIKVEIEQKTASPLRPVEGKEGVEPEETTAEEAREEPTDVIEEAERDETPEKPVEYKVSVALLRQFAGKEYLDAKGPPPRRIPAMYIAALVVGVASTLVAMLVLFPAMVVGAAIGAMGFTLVTNAYATHLAKLYVRKLVLTAKEENTIAVHLPDEPFMPPHFAFALVGYGICAVSVFVNTTIGWAIGAVVAIVGTIRVTKFYAEYLALLQVEHLVHPAEPGDVPRARVQKGRQWHWLFVIGAILCFVSTLIPWYPGFYVGFALVILSIISDSRW